MFGAGAWVIVAAVVGPRLIDGRGVFMHFY